jgi:hypothetical protein
MKANPLTNISASRAVASIWGILARLGGLIHSIGEIYQDNVEPGGIFIYSWTEGPIAKNLGGEPAMTILPNLLLSGVLTIIISIVVIAWTAAFVQRKNGGRV